VAPIDAVSESIESVALLAAGCCRHPEAMTRRGAPWKAHRFPSVFGLIVHRTGGAILFDTGYAPRFDAATRRFPERLYRWLTPVTIPPGDTARAQLATLGIAADDVTTVVVSHFHADHVAGLRDFPGAAIVCSAAAWNAVRGLGRLPGLRRGFLRDLMPDDVAARVRFVEDCAEVELAAQFAPFRTGRDLFGDGSALTMPLPGHMEGHIGLLLPHAPDGPTFFIGDAAWSHAAYEDGVPPPTATTALLGDTASYLETLRALGELHRANPRVRIVPSHAQPPATALRSSDR
jgi:glyoxylase-like metal-dependent hydrolase (beta-lactamase superfamily II)